MRKEIDLSPEGEFMRCAIMLFKYHIIVAADCDVKKFVSREKAWEILERGEHGMYWLSDEFENPLLNDREFLLRASHDLRLFKDGMLLSAKSGFDRGRMKGFVRVADSWIVNVLPRSFSVLLQRRVAAKLLPKIFGGDVCIVSIDNGGIVRLGGG